MNPQIKVLSKNTPLSRENSRSTRRVPLDESEPTGLNVESQPSLKIQSTVHELPPVFDIKLGSQAKTFKLIDDKLWNIVPDEPSTETSFFENGHSAMSIVSVIGPKGVGKSTLLNKIARKEAFQTYSKLKHNHANATINLKHVTRGIDIHSTNHRILLDCQPLLASSVLAQFLSGRSNSQFSPDSQIADPLVSCHMISLQLVTFLIATCDYVIIMVNWLIDVHLLKLISSAIMLIGEDNIRSKFIMFSKDKEINNERFKNMVDKLLGVGRVERFFSNEEELYNHIAPYSDEKCELYHKEPTTFTGKNWLSSCQRIWNSTIKSSSMFVDYADQLYHSNYSSS